MKRLYKESIWAVWKELLKEKNNPKKKEIEDPDELDPNDFETIYNI